MGGPEGQGLRRVLVFAYYYPPMGLSGVQRVAKFTRYLPLYGWQPTVITAATDGYFAYDETLLREVLEAGVEVEAVRTLDPTRLRRASGGAALPPEGRRRRLARLSQWLLAPDNKIGWLPFALRRADELLARRPYDAVFASAPPYTALLAGASVSRRRRLPLVVDFRDDWVGNPRHLYPTPLHRAAHLRMERAVLRRAYAATAINPVICAQLAARHAGLVRPEALRVLPQGYDADDFTGPPAPRTPGALRLVYSGIFYDAQTPDVLFEAAARLLERRPALRPALELVFVGLLPEPSKALARRLGLEANVRDLGYRPHREAVAVVRSADVLWMTVGRRPGAESITTSKLYEYFGARLPILGLVPEGDARRALVDYGASFLAEPDDVGGIADCLERIAGAWREGRLPAPEAGFAERFERRALTGRLAALLDEAAAHGK